MAVGKDHDLVVGIEMTTEMPGVHLQETGETAVAVSNFCCILFSWFLILWLTVEKIILGHLYEYFNNVFVFFGMFLSVTVNSVLVK